MYQLLPIICFAPLASSVLLMIFGSKFSKAVVNLLGVGSLFLSAVLTLIIGVDFLQHHETVPSYTVSLGEWFSQSKLQVSFSLYLDALSLVWMFVITFVGAWIHLFSVGYMTHEKDYARFFACMNLFICAMLLLVLGGNLVLLYLGWEGVGLCSYLLIGFWYTNPENGYAARKAFIITRIGDTALAIGLFMLFTELGSLQITSLQESITSYVQQPNNKIALIGFLLLIGGMGKSAQVPLHTWLPDAMAGPTPVSALIHAATMVTAGVYLIARMHFVFEQSTLVMHTVAIVGLLSVLIAGTTALAQSDIKKVLAYSTISQIGYMFLALGVGAWSAAVFHFMVHAFFKALLFLGAGAIIHVLHHEQDLYRMGGLRKMLPSLFYVFAIGTAALSALPFVTAGFYSKDAILWFTKSAEQGSQLYWLLALAGAFITAVYSIRLLWLVFYGEAKTHLHEKAGLNMMLPLWVLAILSIVSAVLELPHNWVHHPIFSGFVQQVLPAANTVESGMSEAVHQVLASALTLIALFVGYRLVTRPAWKETMKGLEISVRDFFFKGWYFDQLYDILFVQPFLFITRVNKADVTDLIYNGISSTTGWVNRQLSFTQSGALRWYLFALVAGSILFISLYWLR
jgi:NADH-quinone oxidoreductase subunit L